MSLKGSGEALAQLIAEKANPKTDVWFGGTGDPHLQAAEQDLTLEYKSPTLPQLHAWAQQQAAQSGYKTVGIYSGAAGLWLQHRAARQEEAAGAQDAGPTCSTRATRARSRSPTRPRSGTAYTMIATLVQLMGEDKAFDYMKALHKNISQLHPHAAPAPSRRWRAARPRCRSASCTTAPARHAGLPGRDRHARRRHRRRDRLDEPSSRVRATWSRRRSSTNGRSRPAAQEIGAAAKQFQLPSNKARRSTRACPTSRRSSSSTTTTPSTAPAPSAAA